MRKTKKSTLFITLASLLSIFSFQSCTEKDSELSTFILQGSEYAVVLPVSAQEQMRVFQVNTAVSSVTQVDSATIDLGLDIKNSQIFLEEDSILTVAKDNSTNDNNLFLLDLSDPLNFSSITSANTLPQAAGSLAISKKHKSVYVLAQYPDYNIDAYKYDEDLKTFTRHSNTPFSITNLAYVGIAAHPTKDHLYLSAWSTSNNITHVTLDPSSGEIQSYTHYTIGNQNHFLKVSPDGKFLIVANTSSSAIRVFDIDQSTGAISENSNSPYIFGDGAKPVDLVITSDSKTIYTVAHATNKVYGLDISETGEISQITGSPFGPGSDSDIIGWSISMSYDENILVAKYRSGDTFEIYKRDKTNNTLSLLHREKLEVSMGGANASIIKIK